MNVAIMKTRAETSYLEQFEAAVAHLPGTGPVQAARRSAIARFAELGLPHRRLEDWKYTDLRAVVKDAPPPVVPRAVNASATPEALHAALGALDLADAHRLVFVDGSLRPELGTAVAPGGVTVSGLAAMLTDPARAATLLSGWPADSSDDAIAALNTAFVTDGAVIDVAAGADSSKPILIVHARTAHGAGAITARTLVRLAAGANATLVEVHIDLGNGAHEAQSNISTSIALAEGSELQHVKVAAAHRDLHLSASRVDVGASARYRSILFVESPQLARNQTTLRFGGQDASTDISGVILARGGEHADVTLVVDHATPRCTSRELFKSVLDGRGRGIFQGKIIVRPDAQKTDGKMMAQALMLSPDAEFDSKPELEIYADDVVCGHGSTVAEIDADLLFYCRSRGIPEAEAKAMLVVSFIGEALDKIDHEPLRQALEERAAAWLAAGARR